MERSVTSITASHTSCIFISHTKLPMDTPLDNYILIYMNIHAAKNGS